MPLLAVIVAYLGVAPGDSLSAPGDSLLGVDFAMGYQWVTLLLIHLITGLIHDTAGFYFPCVSFTSIVLITSTSDFCYQFQYNTAWFTFSELYANNGFLP